ncbi:VOC family protein [Hyphomicrobium sp. NDB2Meth4]|uniref:VOC family protein n=1 Tax=Hyphomicrobium sp. NDB2Meth4 TaxID=1892846 RepID=UPI000931490B|nr:VOC family protein [Hyphomicrobium sp. NDB2Meth4]
MTNAPLGLSLVTLGVADLSRARAFYTAMGLAPSPQGNDNVVFFQMPGGVLGLYSRAALADDATVDAAGSGFAGITLACNLDSSADVDAMIARAATAGGRVVKPGQTVFWGGYSGYFADPDGHLWEVAHNPFFAKDDRGVLAIG